MSAPARSVILIAIFAGVGFGVSAVTSGEVEKIADVADSQYRAGAFVYELVGPSGARVDARKCHSLNGADGVVAAGGVMSSSVITLESQPDARLRLAAATPGYVAAAWPEADGGSSISIFAGSGLQALGVQSGGTVRYLTEQGDSHLLHVDSAAEGPSVSGEEMLLVTVAPPAGSLSSCVVLVHPPAMESAGEAFAGFFGAGTTVRQVLLPSELVAAPQELFENRLSRWGWLVAGMVCAVVLVGSWLARRQEFALYRLIGFPETAVLTMLLIEAAAVCVIPAQLGIIVGATTTGFSLDAITVQSLCVDIARFDVLLVAVPAIGYVLLPRRSLIPSLLGK